jgi:hypothetical protein
MAIERKSRSRWSETLIEQWRSSGNRDRETLIEQSRSSKKLIHHLIAIL